MTWRYSGDPSSSEKDEVRYLVGDTNEDEPFATDEEITYALAQERDVNGAVARVAESIYAMLAREVDVKVGPLSVSLEKQAEHFKNLAATFRAKSLVYAIPSVGGISIDGKLEQEDDTDRVKPGFVRGMHRNAGNSQDLAPDWHEESA